MEGGVGRGERIRTSDHLNPIQVRYRAAPRPDHYVRGESSTESDRPTRPRPPAPLPARVVAIALATHVSRFDAGGGARFHRARDAPPGAAGREGSSVDSSLRITAWGDAPGTTSRGNDPPAKSPLHGLTHLCRLGAVRHPRGARRARSRATAHKGNPAMRRTLCIAAAATRWELAC